MTTQAEKVYDELEPGAEIDQPRNQIYVNLRAGRIGQVSNKPLDGYEEFVTHNKSGGEYRFYAKTYGGITGYITDIRWHQHQLENGVMLADWNIKIDTGDQTFLLTDSKNEQPFDRLMNVLLNVDFDRRVKFVGFWDKNKKKRLLLSQGIDPETKKHVWVQPAHEAKWLSRLIKEKLRNKVELTEDEERNVSRNRDGGFNANYPYISQSADGQWSFNLWTDFLFDAMHEFVIPAVKEAEMKRAATRNADRAVSATMPEDIDGIPDEPAYTGKAQGDFDDDIPF